MVYATSSVDIRQENMIEGFHVFMRTLAMFLATCYLQAKAQNSAQHVEHSAGQATTQEEQEAGNVASATEGKPSPEANEKLQHLSAELNLTDDQKEKIKPVLQQESQQLTSLHDETSMSTEQREERPSKFMNRRGPDTVDSYARTAGKVRADDARRHAEVIGMDQPMAPLVIRKPHDSISSQISRGKAVRHLPPSRLRIGWQNPS